MSAGLNTGVLAVMNIAMAAYFRRHLMLWKVFAPRFMLAQFVTLFAGGVGVGALIALGAGMTAVGAIYDIFQ